jgi:hypothetical protein
VHPDAAPRDGISQPRFFLDDALAPSGQASASEKAFVKCAENFGVAKSVSAVRNRNHLRNNTMGLAQLLKNYFPSARRILVRNRESFQ